VNTSTSSAVMAMAAIRVKPLYVLTCISNIAVCSVPFKMRMCDRY
jgi:hypothetical protein